MKAAESRGCAWVLNLDAEHELETAGSYTPSRALRELVRRQRKRLIGNLVAPGDVVLDDDAQIAPGSLRGRLGLAWSPTPRALARLAAAGAEVASAPSVEVLRAVNARPFAARVRDPLAAGSFTKHVAYELEGALERIARPAPEGWLVRRPFGAAGRGRRRLHAGSPDPAERAWLAAALRSGPLVIEPWVTITREYTRSGWVAPTGVVIVAPPCLQQTTPTGAWTGTQAAAPDEVDRADDERLGQAVEAAGRALAEAGYFGAFGVDAFRHRDPVHAGRTVLNPLSEINARFTMDWTTGMGVRAPHR